LLIALLGYKLLHFGNISKNVATYTQAMQSANTYIEAKKIYQEMRSNFIQPSARPFAVLMGKANDSEIALSWLIENG